jgi:predicted transcriptional regulator
MRNFLAIISGRNNGRESDESSEEMEFLKSIHERVKSLEKEIVGETLEEKIKNGSIKGKKARDLKQKIDFITEL